MSRNFLVEVLTSCQAELGYEFDTSDLKLKKQYSEAAFHVEEALHWLGGTQRVVGLEGKAVSIGEAAND